MSRGIAVTALTRNAASALVLREPGIEAVAADPARDARPRDWPAWLLLSR